MSIKLNNMFTIFMLSMKEMKIREPPGTGVAISKNYIATYKNCHVVLDYEYSEQNKKAIYYDTIIVRNLLDEDKWEGKIV